MSTQARESTPALYSGAGEDPEALVLRRTTTATELNDALAGLAAPLREVMVLRELEDCPTKISLLVWVLGSSGFNTHRSASSIQEVVSAHIRSLMADRLTGLASAERHSVKTWLSNRLDFAHPVQDLDNHGLHLVGGRLD